jgi:hypothetical protein
MLYDKEMYSLRDKLLEESEEKPKPKPKKKEGVVGSSYKKAKKLKKYGKSKKIQ